MAETRATASIPASTRVVAERLDPLRCASGLFMSARANDLSSIDEARGTELQGLLALLDNVRGEGVSSGGAGALARSRGRRGRRGDARRVRERDDLKRRIG
jgi:hypothetical protein